LKPGCDGKFGFSARLNPRADSLYHFGMHPHSGDVFPVLRHRTWNKSLNYIHSHLRRGFQSPLGGSRKRASFLFVRRVISFVNSVISAAIIDYRYHTCVCGYTSDQGQRPLAGNHSNICKSDGKSTAPKKWELSAFSSGFFRGNLSPVTRKCPRCDLIY
jgi:hypothetical protein